MPVINCLNCNSGHPRPRREITQGVASHHILSSPTHPQTTTTTQMYINLSSFLLPKYLHISQFDCRQFAGAYWSICRSVTVPFIPSRIYILWTHSHTVFVRQSHCSIQLAIGIITMRHKSGCTLCISHIWWYVHMDAVGVCNVYSCLRVVSQWTQINLYF